MAKPQSLDSLFGRVRKTKSGCWNFHGCFNKKTGYGVAGYRGRVMNAHRIVWSLLHGHISDKKTLVCHKCDNRKCINPDHLFLGTAKDNYQDMIKKGRHRPRGINSHYNTHCQRGHKYTESNTYRKRNGARLCRHCQRIRDRKRRNKHQQRARRPKT